MIATSEESAAGEDFGTTGEAAEAGEAMTAAARARAERNRQRARALREARLVHRPPVGEGGAAGEAGASRVSGPVLSAGGFLVEAPEPPRRRAQPPAPAPLPADQPHCLHCHRPFPNSYLYDTFDYCVCDACRDDSEAHSLVTRTEALSEYLLKECDLDKRPPPLRCINRKNPHRARYAEMRLYLRPQVVERALEVWGSEEALEREREARRERQARAKHTAQKRRLRALRMDVRSSLYDRTTAAHAHSYGPETRCDDDEDTYSRVCTECGHVDTYEKM